MICKLCHRGNLTERELEVHTKYFHSKGRTTTQSIAQGVCPECGSTLFFQEGCYVCKVCGFGKCE